MGPPAPERWHPYRPPSEAKGPALDAPAQASGSAISEPGPEAGPEPEAELWRRWRASADGVAHARLVERYREYARSIAATLFARRVHNEVGFEDYHQLAMVGLLEAIERYDPDRGAQFTTFAARRVRGSIHNGLEHLTERCEQAAMRRRLELERTVSLVPEEVTSSGDELLARLGEIGVSVALAFILDGIGLGAGDREERVDDPYAQTELRQVRRQVWRAVERLPDRERRVVELHYREGRPFEQIAVLLEVSRARVSQLHREAVERLRAFVSKAMGCDIAY